MTTQLSRRFTLAALLALITGLTGCCSWYRHCHQVLIINQPQSQTVQIGSTVTFSVMAVKGPPYSTNGVSYQWQVNKTLLSGNLYWTNLSGVVATNSSVTIPNAQITDVGFYRVLVSGSPKIPSDPADLQVFSTTAGGTTVYGTPFASTGKGSCGTGKVYYHINYTNSPPSWGWAVINAGLTATCQNAGSRTDTKFEYLGSLFDQSCSPGSSVSVIMATTPPPTHTPSPRYIFTVYFTGTTAPPSPYPVLLTNLQ